MANLDAEIVATGGAGSIPLPLTDFKNNKSILPTFSFLGEFHSSTGGDQIEALKYHHIRSVSYEQHTFKQEGQYHGPGILKTFPVLDRAENGAYKLVIVFEEDTNGTIMRFIEFLKAKIIKPDGLYNSIAKMKDLSFNLYVRSNTPHLIQFQNVYFQTVEANDFSYGESDMKTYTVTFAYENYSIISKG